jgi:hypothetical protein
VLRSEHDAHDDVNLPMMPSVDVPCPQHCPPRWGRVLSRQVRAGGLADRYALGIRGRHGRSGGGSSRNVHLRSRDRSHRKDTVTSHFAACAVRDSRRRPNVFRRLALMPQILRLGQPPLRAWAMNPPVELGHSAGARLRAWAEVPRSPTTSSTLGAGASARCVECTD